MSGTVAGGLKAAQKNIASNPNFYSEIGGIGGRNGHSGGFASNMLCDGSCDLDDIFGLEHKKAQCAGYKGGLKSRRGKDKTRRAKAVV